MEEHIKDLETCLDIFILTMGVNILYFPQQNDYVQRAYEIQRMDVFTT